MQQGGKTAASGGMCAVGAVITTSGLSKTFPADIPAVYRVKPFRDVAPKSV